MALSGSLKTNAWVNSESGSQSWLEFSWTATQDEDGNQSTISWVLKGVRNVSGYVYAGGYAVVIDGDTVYSKSTNYRMELYNGTVVASGSKTLTHKPDGTRSFDVSIQGGIYLYEPNCTGSKTFDLNTIPRASAITAAAGVTLGNTCDVRWTPMSTAFGYKLRFSLGTWEHTTDAIHPNTTSAYAYTGYTIPLEVAEQILSGYTGLMKVDLYTYSDSAATNQIGSADPEVFTVTVPKSEAPTLTMHLSPVHSLPAAFNGIYVQGLSKVKATFDVTLKHNATAQSYDMTVDGLAYGVYSDYTSGYLTTTGDVKVVGHVKDSRTYDGYDEEVIKVIPYAKPKIQSVSARRCDQNGNVTDTGTYLKITATRSYHPVISDNVQKNYCKIQYRYKVEGTSRYSDWMPILDSSDLSSDSVVTAPLLNGGILTTRSYRVEVQAIDDIGNDSTSEILIPTDTVYWHRDGARNALGLGKYNEQDNALDMGWDIYMNENKLTGLADPVNNSDAVTLGFLKEYIKDYIANLPKG